MPLVEYRTTVNRALAGSPASPYAYLERGRLLLATQINDYQISVDGWPTAIANGYLVIDAYTTICEVRRITSVSGTDIELSAGLSYTHAQDALCFWHAGAINAQWFGALADGSTDDEAALQAAIDAAADVGGALLIPAGEYALAQDASLSVPSGMTILGDGPTATVIIIHKSSSEPTLALTGVTDVTVRDLGVRCDTVRTASPVTANTGISIDGCSRILIDNVHITGTFVGVEIGNQTANNNDAITLRNCIARQTATYATAYQCNYGLHAQYCDGLIVDGCMFAGWWLDGIKINRNCTNVKIVNCASTDNGVSYDYGGNGQGIDLYPGGNSVLIMGGEFSRNKGGGIYAKASDVNLPPDNYGSPRGLRVVGAVCKGNTGPGLGIENPGDPLVFQVSIVGGLFEENTTYGIYLAGRQVTIEGTICRKNNYAGIEIASASYGITLIGCQIIANGQASAGSYHGINISAQDVLIIAPYVNGADSDTIGEYGDDAALTKYHNRSIYIGASADNVQVIGGWYRNQSSASDHIASAAGATGIIINRPMTRTPEAYSAHSAGSLVVDATTGYAYLKTSATGTTTGWQRIATTDML